MHFNLTLFLSALGLACVLEALPWLISPKSMQNTLVRLAELPAERLRSGGFLLLALGLLLCAAGRTL